MSEFYCHGCGKYHPGPPQHFSPAKRPACARCNANVMARISGRDFTPRTGKQRGRVQHMSPESVKQARANARMSTNEFIRRYVKDK